jgi:hypothetical protein
MMTAAYPFNYFMLTKSSSRTGVARLSAKMVVELPASRASFDFSAVVVAVPFWDDRRAQPVA